MSRRRAPHGDPRSGRFDRNALLVYTFGWLGAGAVLALIALAFVSGREDEVSLPPVRRTELTDAARAAGCVLRGPESSEPVVSGPRAAAAPPGVYSRPPAQGALIGALRRGSVIIHYRSSLGRNGRERLERLQKAVPTGTIVTPNQRMRYVVAVAAWERLLGCPGFGEETMDAIRLFRGRFIGSGPDT